MRLSAYVLLSGTIAAPALAEPLKFTPLIDTRLRWEQVEQEGPPPVIEDADAVTARVRLGFELSNHDFAFLAEAESTMAIDASYNSGLNGKVRFPIVADPENIELNRVQLQYRGLPGALVTVGRQRINLDDQQFVGSVGWRDNEQTFDAARIEWTLLKPLKLDVTYAWSNRTIWGMDGFGARRQAVSGDNVFANLTYTTKLGNLTGFAYLVDQDEAVVLRNSSRTFGARFAGAAPLSKKVKLTYAASYAWQTDHHHNPNDYSAEYYLAEAGLEMGAFKLGAGYEVLGADDGLPLTSFQTPLATLHKFQGWADKFLVTPPDGIRDLYGTVGYGFTKVGPFDSIAIGIAYHRYDSDRMDIRYGDEINAQIVAKFSKKFTALAKCASYDAKGFATDTRKFWLSLEWVY